MLEQKSIGYTYPGTERPAPFRSASSSRQSSKESHDSPVAGAQPPAHSLHPDSVAPNRSAPGAQADGAFDDWQIVVPISNQSPDGGGGGSAVEVIGHSSICVARNLYCFSLPSVLLIMDVRDITILFI